MKNQNPQPQKANLLKSLPQESQELSVVDTLRRSLADEYVLQLKTQNCHWNVEGPLFFSLHKLFEEQYQALFEHIDTLAETLRALKVKAPGTLKEFRDLASLQDSPNSNLTAEQMIEMLQADHTHMAMALKDRREIADQAEEVSAVVLYEDLIKFHEKAAWMIRSHQERN